ncbi:hypothetical protein EB810_13530 [Altererythrobacter sp. FM1]|uniref:hypothetical protein n=1 Tax=Tsuneonella flava TaxID=2055955 RepID=UPI000C7FB031|nr:hypothetical protein [Tsuneonella flava]ROT94096.1 hypothetical protein EB810_13530 [Altererythrobacter sp. FM1]
MTRSYLVVGIHEIHLDDSGGFIALRFQANDGKPVGIGLHPEMAHDLALGLLGTVADGTSRGILPAQLLPTMSPTTNLSANESGLEVEYDLSDGLRIASEMPWPVARELAEKMLRLCDENDAAPSMPN